MKSRVILLTFLIALTSITSAFKISLNSATEKWTLYKSIDGVNIYSKATTCFAYGVNNTYLLFKYENTTNERKELSWRLDIWFGENCRSCNLPSPNEYEFSLYLNPKETKEGNCKYLDDKRFMIYKASENAKLQPLAKFEFSNLTVK